jgi:hypothetical protein
MPASHIDALQGRRDGGGLRQGARRDQRCRDARRRTAGGSERLRRRDFGGDHAPPRSGHGSSYESDPTSWSRGSQPPTGLLCVSVGESSLESEPRVLHIVLPAEPVAASAGGLGGRSGTWNGPAQLREDSEPSDRLSRSRRMRTRSPPTPRRRISRRHVLRRLLLSPSYPDGQVTRGFPHCELAGWIVLPPPRVQRVERREAVAVRAWA